MSETNGFSMVKERASCTLLDGYAKNAGALRKMAEVVKVVYYMSGKEETVLFENREMRRDPIEQKEILFHWRNSAEEQANEEKRLNCDFHIKHGNRVFVRDYIHLKIPERVREILSIKSGGKSSDIITYLIQKKEFEGELQKEIEKQEIGFCLSEKELIEEADNIIKGIHKWRHFRTHVEIDGRIADGLAFVGEERCFNAKIIGFEAKTNKDNYFRLYEQLNSYLSICDEVYLIVEDKKIPKDLPFYVGVIRVENCKGKIIRNPQSLKHSVDVNECWSTLLKAFNTHAGLERSQKTISFFDAVENIKRKLIWNQFVIGFHQTYVKDYVELTSEEKRIIRAFFGDDQIWW